MVTLRLVCQWCDEPITDPSEHDCCNILFGDLEPEEYLEPDDDALGNERLWSD